MPEEPSYGELRHRLQCRHGGHGGFAGVAVNSVKGSTADEPAQDAPTRLRYTQPRGAA
jgi:hypothetical protein